MIRICGRSLITIFSSLGNIWETELTFPGISLSTGKLVLNQHSRQHSHPIVHRDLLSLFMFQTSYLKLEFADRYPVQRVRCNIWEIRSEELEIAKKNA